MVEGIAVCLELRGRRFPFAAQLARKGGMSGERVVEGETTE
jgi:hypothetical protein